MKPFFTQPSTDLDPLKEECFFQLPEKLSEHFVHEATKVANSLTYHSMKANHREYKETPDPYDPHNVMDNIDPFTLVRQPKQKIRQEIGLALAGNVSDDTPMTNMIRKALGDKSNHFTEIWMFQLESDANLLPHKDAAGTCRIYIPIWPLGIDYSRLELYHNNQIYYLYNMISPPPMYLFNSMAIHGVYNEGYPKRWNMQISTDLTYDEAIQLWL